MKSPKKLSEKKMSGDEKQHSVVTLVYFVFYWNDQMREEITNKSNKNKSNKNQSGRLFLHAVASPLLQRMGCPEFSQTRSYLQISNILNSRVPQYTQGQSAERRQFGFVDRQNVPRPVREILGLRSPNGHLDLLQTRVTNDKVEQRQRGSARPRVDSFQLSINTQYHANHIQKAIHLHGGQLIKFGESLKEIVRNGSHLFGGRCLAVVKHLWVDYFKIVWILIDKLVESGFAGDHNFEFRCASDSLPALHDASRIFHRPVLDTVEVTLFFFE